MWQKIKDFFTSLWKNYAVGFICNQLDTEIMRDKAVNIIAKLRQSSKTDDELWTEVKEEIKILIKQL